MQRVLKHKMNHVLIVNTSIAHITKVIPMKTSTRIIKTLQQSNRVN